MMRRYHVRERTPIPAEVYAESAEQTALALRLIIASRGRRTQVELAELLEMHQAQVSYLLAGRANLNTNTLIHVAHRLGYRLIVDFEKVEP